MFHHPEPLLIFHSLILSYTSRAAALPFDFHQLGKVIISTRQSRELINLFASCPLNQRWGFIMAFRETACET